MPVFRCLALLGPNCCIPTLSCCSLERPDSHTCSMDSTAHNQTSTLCSCMVRTAPVNNQRQLCASSTPPHCMCGTLQCLLWPQLLCQSGANTTLDSHVCHCLLYQKLPTRSPQATYTFLARQLYALCSLGTSFQQSAFLQKHLHCSCCMCIVWSAIVLLLT
jgi:hypothetical protein